MDGMVPNAEGQTPLAREKEDRLGLLVGENEEKVASLQSHLDALKRDVERGQGHGIPIEVAAEVQVQNSTTVRKSVSIIPKFLTAILKKSRCLALFDLHIKGNARAHSSCPHSQTWIDSPWL